MAGEGSHHHRMERGRRAAVVEFPGQVPINALTGEVKQYFKWTVIRLIRQVESRASGRSTDLYSYR